MPLQRKKVKELVRRVCQEILEEAAVQMIDEYKSQFQRHECSQKTFEYKQLTTIRAHSKYKYAAKKLLNKDLRRDSDFKEKLERANREATHLRAHFREG